jgi:hypothetical protein
MSGEKKHESTLPEELRRVDPHGGKATYVAFETGLVEIALFSPGNPTPRSVFRKKSDKISSLLIQGERVLTELNERSYCQISKDDNISIIKDMKIQDGGIREAVIFTGDSLGLLPKIENELSEACQGPPGGIQPSIANKSETPEATADTADAVATAKGNFICFHKYHRTVWI